MSATASSTSTLALTSVIASGLPTDIGAVGAADRYTVPAVFNRRPEALEIQALGTASARTQLRDAGYPDVTLEVEDRRLLIGGTNLQELEAGLAVEVATLVDEISRNVATERQRRADVAQTESDDRAEQARVVARAAEKITFVPRSSAS